MATLAPSPAAPSTSAATPPMTRLNRLAYGSGAIANGIKNAAFSTYLLLFYNQVLGVSAAIVSGAIALTLLVDASPLPLTNEPLMVLAIGADVGLWAIFGVMSAGSTLAGVVGWIGGRIIGQHTAPGRWLMLRYPAVQLFLVRWGALGVAIAALTPIPFGLTAWAAGMARVPFWKVALASVARVPKTGFYLWLIAQGWALGG